jgi:hypothetical protein
MAWYLGLYCPSNCSDINANAIENHIKLLSSKQYHDFKTHLSVIDQSEERSSTMGWNWVENMVIVDAVSKPNTIEMDSAF